MTVPVTVPVPKNFTPPILDEEKSPEVAVIPPVLAIEMVSVLACNFNNPEVNVNAPLVAELIASVPVLVTVTVLLEEPVLAMVKVFTVEGKPSPVAWSAEPLYI